jgi:hypothetical protein
MPANELDFEPKPDFFKWGFDFIGPASGETFYCWYFWTHRGWLKDRSFCDRHNRLQRLSDWQQNKKRSS